MQNGGAPLIPPRYLHLDLPKHVMRNVSRFRLRAHTLAVESSIWRGGMATVTSVPVLLFKMRCMFYFTVKTCLCALSEEKFSLLFFPFCQSLSVEAPFIPHALPSQTVFDFLSQRHNRLCHFISDIMDYFLAGEDQQQTNQPDDLAGG